ncbi:hypothetical protein HPB50_006230 [Hyalomma asiaticum]|uniref:Uncharacterized protein n=1 Tax=Hyalomma asiaticum TaxID=266040 RepID=A0ACB7SH41_HYAAI|nr:hypothetical protein HPB50_006230 [Hyalomma asiaticum]
MVGEAHEFRAGRIPDSALNLPPSQSGLAPTPFEEHGRERFDIATGHLNPHGRLHDGRVGKAVDHLSDVYPNDDARA